MVVEVGRLRRAVRVRLAAAIRIACVLHLMLQMSSLERMRGLVQVQPTPKNGHHHQKTERYTHVGAYSGVGYR